MSMLILTWTWTSSFITAGGGGHGRGAGTAPAITDLAGFIIEEHLLFITGCRPDGGLLIKPIVIRTGNGTINGYPMMTFNGTGVIGKRQSIGINNKSGRRITTGNLTAIKTVKKETETDEQQRSRSCFDVIK